jgi:TfoX/Sxy family transcriptional regulator of competence genes
MPHVESQSQETAKKVREMAFDERLAKRVRDLFAARGVSVEEKRMMGGLCFMVNGKMCVGIAGTQLMVRLDPAIYEESLRKPGCVPMDFTGRPMRGFVFVNPEGTSSSKSLELWIDVALEFNPRAKASSPRKPRKTAPRKKPASHTTQKPRKSRP